MHKVHDAIYTLLQAKRPQVHTGLAYLIPWPRARIALLGYYRTRIKITNPIPEIGIHKYKNQINSYLSAKEVVKQKTMKTFFTCNSGLSGGSVGAGCLPFIALGVIERVIDISRTEAYRGMYKIAFSWVAFCLPLIYMFRFGVGQIKVGFLLIGLPMGSCGHDSIRLNGGIECNPFIHPNRNN